MLTSLVFAVLMVSACGGGGVVESAGPPPPLVRVAEVSPGELDEAWTALGEVRALESAELSAGAAGAVVLVAGREGDAVARGALLVEVDTALAGARAAGAYASVKEAEAELARLRDALTRRERVRESVLSEEELADARAAVTIQEARAQVLQAAAAEAQAALALHRVRAPFDGVIVRRTVDPGDWVTAGQQVIALLSREGREVRVQVPQALALRLDEGTTVGLAGGEGSIVRVVPALDPTTRTALIRITPAASLALTPGQAVDVQLPVSWRGVGVTVPRDALLTDPRSARVFKVSDGAAVSVAVEVLATTSEAALVVSDELAVGDQVITRGNERVRAGQSVRVEGGE